MKTQAQQLYTPGQGRQLFAEFVKAACRLEEAQNEPERFGCVGPSHAELAMNQLLTLAGNICTALDSPPENADAMLKAQRDELAKDAARYRWLAAYARSISEHWGGRWSIVIDGPAPKSHDSEDDFDAAIDAAIAKAEGGAA